MNKISLLPIFFLFFVSCESVLDDTSFYDYSIEQNRGCFCGLGGVWIKLYIRADTVSAAKIISNDNDLTYEEFKYYESINGLFDLITYTDTTKYELRYTIDSVKNYPTIVYLNPKPIIINDTTIIIIEDAQVSYMTKNYIKYD